MKSSSTFYATARRFAQSFASKGMRVVLASSLTVAFTGLPAYAIASADTRADAAAAEAVSEIATAFDGETFADEESGLLFTVLDDGTVSVGNGVDGALIDNEATSVQVPNTVVHDGISYAVSTLGAYSFYDTAIEEISLPEGLVTIDARAFKFCRDLESVDIPDSVESIGGYAFFGDVSLKHVGFGENSRLTTLGKGVFAFGSTFDGDKDSTDNVSSLESISLPSGITEIPDSLFSSNTALKSCIINSPSLVRIGNYAFYECTALESIDIPVLTDTSTYRLGTRCFSGCSSLLTVIFRGDMDLDTATITSGTEFASCTTVEKVVCYGKGLYERAYSGNHGLLTFSDDVERYYTVYFYDDEEDAKLHQNSLGYVVVLEGTTKAEICSGADKEKIFDSKNYEDFVGNGWVFENGLHADGALEDTCYAVACDKNDLAYADIVMGEGALLTQDADGNTVYTYIADGKNIDFGITVVNAAGQTLASTDYDLAATDGQGLDVDASSIHAPGIYTISAVGKGRYAGTQTEPVTVEVLAGIAQWSRLFGSDRYDTMKAIVDASFTSYDYSSSAQGSAGNDRCEYAVVASGENFPDALAASSLAGALQAPVILTDVDTLSSQAAYEISRIGARKVVVIGGTNAISSEAEQQIGSVFGVTNVYRIQGADRYETARKIYSVGGGITLGAQWSDTCIIASGEGFADALSISSYAYSSSSPIFLCGTSGLDEQMLAQILSGGFTKAIIAGGSNAVPDIVEQQLSGMDIVRLAGATRYDTSIEIASYFLASGDLTADGAALATGENFPDALAGGALCGLAHAPLILYSETEPENALLLLEQYKATMMQGYLLGGEQVLSDEVLKRVEAIWS